MQGIQVLADILIGSGVKNDGFAASKGNAGSVRPDASSAFAALFGTLMSAGIDPKGQQSSKPGYKFENPTLPGIQNPYDEDKMPGKGDFVFSIFEQPAFQSNLPAGKEANSGFGMSQEANMLPAADSLMNALLALVAGKNAESPLADLLSLVAEDASAQSGMTAAKAQSISELDQYRQLIEKLLAELSGDLGKDAAKGKSLVQEALQQGEISQETAKVIQGWASSLEEKGKQVIRENPSGNQDNGLKTEDQNAKTSVEKLAAELNRLFGKEAQEAKMNQNTEQKIDHRLNNDKEERPAQEQKTGFGELLSKEDSVKTHKSQTAENSGVKPGQDQAIAGINNGNAMPVSVAEGKSVSSPVWEQVSNMLREQLLSRQADQELRQLDLRLHPAELGRIQIAMRWEGGQLHLQFNASELATAQLLQSQLSNLRQALISQGVDCGMLQMGHNGESQKDSQGSEPHKASRHSADFDNENVSAAAVFAFGQDESSLIDVTV